MHYTHFAMRAVRGKVCHPAEKAVRQRVLNQSSASISRAVALCCMDNAAFETLTEIVRDFFEDDSIVLTRATTAKDVEGWDSLAHVRLIVAVERQFQVKFTSSEVAGLKSIGELMDLIDRRRGS
jgi:acyl carrier protein